MFASALASILWLGATGTARCTCSHIAEQHNRSDDVVFLLDEIDASKIYDELGNWEIQLCGRLRGIVKMVDPDQGREVVDIDRKSGFPSAL